SHRSRAVTAGQDPLRVGEPPTADCCAAIRGDLIPRLVAAAGVDLAHGLHLSLPPRPRLRHTPPRVFGGLALAPRGAVGSVCGRWLPGPRLPYLRLLLS